MVADRDQWRRHGRVAGRARVRRRALGTGKNAAWDRRSVIGIELGRRLAGDHQLLSGNHRHAATVAGTLGEGPGADLTTSGEGDPVGGDDDPAGIARGEGIASDGSVDDRDLPGLHADDPGVSGRVGRTSLVRLEY